MANTILIHKLVLVTKILDSMFKMSLRTMWVDICQY